MLSNINNKIKNYLNQINAISEMPDSDEKVSLFSKLLSEYYCFCYKNNIMASLPDIMKLGKSSYILPSIPDIFSIDLQDVQMAGTNLQNALQNNEGVSENDAEILLKWVVQKAREILNNACGDIQNNSLIGYCGLGQALTLLPFQKLGASITINNAIKYPYSNTHHGFGTISLPINLNGKVVNKTYLLDVTYRQFFTTITCHNGRFYSANSANKDKTGPNVGYYILKYPGGVDFAKELLKNGYIELDKEKSKIYGVCFSAQSLNRTNIYNLKNIFNMDDETFYQTLFKNQVELTYNDVELSEIAEAVEIPINKQIYR